MKWLIILALGAAWIEMNAPGLEIKYRPGLEGYAKMVSSEFPATKKLTEQNLAFQSGATVNVFVRAAFGDVAAGPSGPARPRTPGVTPSISSPCGT